MANFEKCLIRISSPRIYEQLKDMKLRRIIFLVSVWTFISIQTYAQGNLIKYKDLKRNSGIYQSKKTNLPFSGEVIGKKSGTLINGKQDGQWMQWYRNGKLRSEGKYQNGKKIGTWFWYYETGQLQSKHRFENGILVDSIKYYEKDGSLTK